LWTRAGIFRDRAGLVLANGALDDAWRAIEEGRAAGRSCDAAAWRLVSVVTVARLIVRAALRREKSRGGHSRTDFPSRDDLHWKRHVDEARSTEKFIG